MVRLFTAFITVLLALGPVTADDVEARLAEAGLILPRPTQSIGNYVTSRRVGSLLYLSGHLECGTRTLGKVGADLTVEQGYEAARGVGLCMLATIKDALGSLDAVKQFVTADGMVNSAPDFTGQSAVLNGFSDLMVLAYGEDGKAARTAVGMASLPVGAVVEISALVEVKD